MFSNKIGLSSEEVNKRRQQYGQNILPEKPLPSNFSLFLQQLKNPFVYVLLLASIVTFVIGDFSDSLIIFFAVFINTILGFIQENKATKALYALKHYVVNKIIVIRDEKRMSVNTSEIVPGDVVILNQGVKIPADGKIIFANRLFVNETILTGESVPVSKDKEDRVFMGTVVSSGQATLLVETIGSITKIGKIALQIQEKEDDTPLQRQLNIFSKQLVMVIGILTIIVFTLGLLHKFNLIEIFIVSIALAVSSIPEGLLVSLTVILAIGMQKIIKHKGLVRKLSAAETLGGVTTICVDKTGTLTQGKMKVIEFIGDEKILAEQVLLANDLDDPIVISAFEWGKRVIPNFIVKYQKLDSIPFSSKERFFVSLHKWTDKNNRIFVNGAPELLLQWTNLSKKEKSKIIADINKLTKQGKRLLGFARKDVNSDKKDLTNEDAKRGLTWVGILAFDDPVRSGVKEALQLAEKAGIKTIMITGDYPDTSRFVLSELGIPVKSGEILLGNELEKLNIKELSQKVKTIKLFARTTPDQKLMIVNALKKNGEIVAMMGDGVNDAPALHKADIGIVVGSATDVAKESADLVLLDSNFATIIEAIREGRGMFENIRKIILYLLSDAFAEIIIIIGSMVIGLPLPITAAQILWINLISDGFPGLALTIDPKRADIMNETPRKSHEKLVNRWMVILIGLVSLTAGMIALLSFVVVYKLTSDITIARSVTFIILGLDSLIYVFSVRVFMVPFWKSKLFENKWLVIAVVAGLGLQILPFTTSYLRDIFGLVNLNLIHWIIAVLLSLLMFFVIEIFKARYKLNTAKRFN